MFKTSMQVTLGVVIIGIFLVIGCKGYAQPVDGAEINIAFQDAMNEVLYPQELPIYELNNNQIKKIILPSAAKIIANSIKLVRERTRKDISVGDVFGALPPKLEKNLNVNIEQITLQVENILKKDK